MLTAQELKQLATEMFATNAQQQVNEIYENRIYPAALEGKMECNVYELSAGAKLLLEQAPYNYKVTNMMGDRDGGSDYYKISWK